MEKDNQLIEMTADIVSAYVGKNSVAASELPNLIGNVYEALNATKGEGPAKAEPPQQPAVPIKKSITNDAIICLEDGKPFKSLKRHLRTKYDMSPEEYRAKWGLPPDYPMVAPSYSKARSKLAKDSGLGQKRGKR